MAPCVSSLSSTTGCRRILHFASLAAASIGAFPAAGRTQTPPPVPSAPGYHLEAKWKPGGDGGWDDLTMDSQAQRLYVARTGSLQIIDTERGTLIHALPGLDGGHGVALAPELNRGFVTSGRSGTVVVFDFTSLRSFGDPIAVGQKPGAVAYEPLTRHAFVFNGESNNASVIDAATSSVVATIPLDGTPEFCVSDGRGMLFVNLEDKNEILAVDARKNAVVHRWPLAPGTEPTGLALDPIKHRLFAGCRNGLMIVLDAPSGQCLAQLSIGKGVDACAFDPGTGLAFASCGDGTLTVAQEDPAKPGEYRVVETVKTQRGARTMALDPLTHAVYLAAADFEAVPASPAGEAPQRPKIIPGSFVLLKFTR